jgi:hypothetical protein
LSSYNADSKVLGDVSIDAPSISCKWKPRNILWTKWNKNQITLLNIIDVIFKILLNKMKYNIVHIPSKLPFVTFHQVSLFIFLQIVWKNNFPFQFFKHLMCLSKPYKIGMKSLSLILPIAFTIFDEIIIFEDDIW